MSKETLAWLNTNVLIGHTDRRGTAWHYRASAQGTEPNHYPGAIPVADVERRLFNWSAEEAEVLVNSPRFGIRRDPSRLAVLADDHGDVLGVHKRGYTIHQYREWLLENVEILLDGGLSIGSAGLLRDRCQAWVSVELPDTLTTPEGMDYRPHLTACTSHDGSLKTTYKRMVTVVVCDNTLSAGLEERGSEIKIAHRGQADLSVLQARQALNLIEVVSDTFAAEVRTLSRIDVSDAAWEAFVHAHAPDQFTPRAQNNAEKLRSELTELWRNDPRVSPWKNTALGVVQAINTHKHHLAGVRGVSRVERNMENAVNGVIDRLDRKTMRTLNTVLTCV